MIINKNIIKDLRNEYGDAFYLLDSSNLKKIIWN